MSNSILKTYFENQNQQIYIKKCDIHPTIDLTHHKAQYKPYRKPKHT
jgi:hypothetical protein